MSLGTTDDPGDEATDEPGDEANVTTGLSMHYM